MQNYIQKIKQSAFLKDNLILFAGTFLAGIFGFLYHFYMGRVLGVEEYGVLGTILAGFYLLNASFVNTLQTSLAKFTSEFNVKQEQGKIKYLIFRSFRKLFLLGVGIFIVYLLFINVISDFLHIERGLLIVSGTLFSFFLLIPAGRGFMQGMQNFKGLSFNYLIEALSKLALGVLFIYLGYQTMGAVVAVILSYLVTILFFWKPIKQFFKVTAVPFETKHIYTYSLPVFFMIVSITLFFSVDVILVKHFFDETNAGLYSALSLLGKIIFFGTLSISQVMFPKVSKQYAEGKKTAKLFYYSLFVVLFCIGFALFVYTFFPKLMVSILFGSQFLPMVPLVSLFGSYIALIAIIYLVSFYLISLNKFRFIFFLVFFNILQIVFISLYHVSLLQVIQLQISLMLALLFLIVITNLTIFIPILSKNKAISIP